MTGYAITQIEVTNPMESYEIFGLAKV